MVRTLLALACAVLGALASAFMLVLLAAGAPNSSPDQLSRIYWLMGLVAAAAFLGLTGSIGAMILKRPRLAALAGIAPAIFSALLFAILLTAS